MAPGMDPRHDVSVDGGVDSRETKSLAMCRTALEEEGEQSKVSHDCCVCRPAWKEARKINSRRPKRIDIDMWWLALWLSVCARLSFCFRDKALDVKALCGEKWERTVIYSDGDNDAPRERGEENNRGISVNYEPPA